jgi:hypothetical protein
MKGYFINPKDKTIKDIVMFTKDVDLQSLINTVHLILGVDKIDGMLYNSYSFLFYRDQHDSHKKVCKHWSEIEGKIETKIIFGSSLILLPEEDGKQITIKNVREYLSDQTHTFIDGQFELSFMSDKWILKKLKRNPEIKTYNELMDYIKLTNVRKDTWTTI